MKNVVYNANVALNHVSVGSAHGPVSFGQDSASVEMERRRRRRACKNGRTKSGRCRKRAR